MTRLMNSQMRRLRKRAPTAIRETSPPRTSKLGRSVRGPASAMTKQASAPDAAMRKAFRSTASSNRSRVRRAQTSTFCASRGQWSISTTRQKSRTVEYTTRKR